MYIRRSLTRTLADGAQYYSHRLVRSERVGGRVRQVTLLNLGSDFTLGPAQWQALCARVEGLLAGEGVVGADLETPAVEQEAQRVAALLVARQSRALPREGGAPELVDLGTLKVSGCRSVGVEHVGLWALEKLRVADQLRGLGMPQRQIAAVLEMIVARMAAAVTGHPRLERWSEHSALGELLGVDFQAFDALLSVRAGAGLLRHRKVLEAHLAARIGDLAGPCGGPPRVCLMLPGVPPTRAPGPDASARRVLGPDVEASPLVLGLACDRHGFIQRSVSVPVRPSLQRSIEQTLERLAAGTAAVHVFGADATAVRAWLLDRGDRPWTDDADAASCGNGVLRDLETLLGIAAAGGAEAGARCGGSGCDAAELFVGVLAYQCVRLVRHRLAAQGIDDDWGALKAVLAPHCRVTISLVCGDGRTLHLRQPTLTEPAQLAIYHALGTDAVPGGVQRTLV